MDDNSTAIFDATSDYLASAGTLTTTSLRPNVTGSVDNLVLQHVTIDGSTLSTPAVVDCTTTSTHSDFDVPATTLFLQGGDGIRDLYVTGVQTCALPIFGPGGGGGRRLRLRARRRPRAGAGPRRHARARAAARRASRRRVVPRRRDHRRRRAAAPVTGQIGRASGREGR